MPKRISNLLKDPNKIAAAVVALSTKEDIPMFAPLGADILSRAMAELGRRGGKIGGKRSLETMTKSARKKRAQKAAKSRWKNK